MAELQDQVRHGVRFFGNTGAALPLQGLMLYLSPPDHAPRGPARYVVALGRFPASDPDAKLVMQITLQGDVPEEQHFSVTTTSNSTSQILSFSPGNNRQAL